MDDEQVMNLVTVLQKQQALQTQAIVAALEGKWTGEGSVEAFLYALNPGFIGQLTPRPPRLED